MAARFVAVDIDAHHEFKLIEGGLEATRIRRRECWDFLAMVRKARTCPSPGSSISSARVATGNSPITSGKVADTAPPATGLEAATHPQFFLLLSWPPGETSHRTGPIEFSCQNIQYIGGPRGQGAKANRVNTYSSVDDPALGMGQFSSQSPDDRRDLHRSAWSPVRGTKGLNGYAHFVEAI